MLSSLSFTVLSCARLVSVRRAAARFSASDRDNGRMNTTITPQTIEQAAIKQNKNLKLNRNSPWSIIPISMQQYTFHRIRPVPAYLGKQKNLLGEQTVRADRRLSTTKFWRHIRGTSVLVGDPIPSGCSSRTCYSRMQCNVLSKTYGPFHGTQFSMSLAGTF